MSLLDLRILVYGEYVVASWAGKALLTAIEFGAFVLAHYFRTVAAIVGAKFDGRAITTCVGTASQTRVDFFLDVLAIALAANHQGWRVTTGLRIRIHDIIQTFAPHLHLKRNSRSNRNLSAEYPI
jgi:hypothetical protein